MSRLLMLMKWNQQLLKKYKEMLTEFQRNLNISTALSIAIPVYLHKEHS